MKNLTNEQKEKIESEIYELFDSDIERLYDIFLDEVYEPFKLSEGVEYYPADIIKSCDPIAYRAGKVDWLSAQIEDGIFVEINRKVYDADEVESVLYELENGIEIILEDEEEES